MNKIDLKAIVKETILESINEVDKGTVVSGPKGEVELDDKAAKDPENLEKAKEMVNEETIEEVVKKMMEANPSLDERRCRNKVYEYYLSEDSDIKDAIMNHAKKQLQDVFDFAKVALRGEPFMGPSMEHDVKQMMMDMIKGVRLSPKTKHLKEDDASQLEAIKTDLVDLVRDLASHFQISNDEAQEMACDMIQGITISEETINEVDMSDRDTVEAFQDLEDISYKLKELSQEAKQIMKANFPMAYERASSYGVFDFGGQEGRYSVTFDKVLRDIEEGYED